MRSSASPEEQIMTSDNAAVNSAGTETDDHAKRELALRAIESRAEVSWVALFFGALFWPALIAGIVAIFNESFRSFLVHWWWALAIPPAIVAILSRVPEARRALEKTALNTRATLFFFVVLPLLFVVVVGPIALLDDPERRAMVLRAVFLIVVCILPAMMWYLFIVTRKASLLNEFIANLDRLGLLQAGEGEADVSRKRRVESYLQKFEALYGDLRDSIHDEVLDNQFKHYSSADAAGLRTLSTATFPVGLFTVLVAIGWLTTLPPFELPPSAETNWVRAFQPTVAPVTLAFLGAYFFSLQMLFRRYVLNDLGGAAYVAASIRIILAVIGIWVLAAIGQSAFSGGEGGDQKHFFGWENQLLLMGFVFGVFPRVIWQIIQSLFVRVARFAVPSMMSQLPVSDLDGLTVWHEARLEEADIENIPNMANADLVELLLNTRLASEQIIDWADQAILYTQLGPQGEQQGDNARQKLRIYGIRTATSLLWASHQGKREAFDKILTTRESDSVMPMLEASLATNSNLKLIRRWRSVSDTPSPSSAEMQIGPKKFRPPPAEAHQHADEKGQPGTVDHPAAA
jgi:hypothetical protein